MLPYSADWLVTNGHRDDCTVVGHAKDKDVELECKVSGVLSSE